MASHDPIELELFRHIFASICEEMGIVLRKTAFSANIKERRDFSCAIYNSSGETAAMGDHMPVHLGAMPEAVRRVTEDLRLGPGDVAIVNDPFRGGTHLPDITAVSGVFLGAAKRPAFYVANRAHHADVGGMSPGSMPLATEIYQEGIRIPPVYLVRQGRIDKAVLRLLLANVRTPDEREGDLRAQCMSLARGESRLRDAVRKYGARRVLGNMEALLDYSERIMRARIRSLPDGRYRFEDYLDGDGMGSGPLPIRVEISVHGSEARVDFRGTARQAAGPVNANLAVTLSAVSYVFRCLLGEEAPFTAGLMRPIQVVAPEGSLVHARPPAAMAAGNVETSQRITDVLLGALSKAAPDLIPAASSGTMNNVSLGGWDPFRRRPFAYYETIAGGMGAHCRGPGPDAVHTHMTNSWNTPIEALEHEYPLTVRAYRIRRGSGGEGRHRGGDGIIRAIEFLTGAEVTLLSERRETRPYGLQGGGAGQAGVNRLRRSGKAILLPAKVRTTVLAGDRLEVETPGGGGFGKPARET